MSCKICGCKMHPCRCIFDNYADFVKYGECFFELELPKKKFSVASLLSSLIKKLCSYPIIKKEI